MFAPLISRSLFVEWDSLIGMPRPIGNNFSAHQLETFPLPFVGQIARKPEFMSDRLMWEEGRFQRHVIEGGFQALRKWRYLFEECAGDVIVRRKRI